MAGDEYGFFKKIIYDFMFPQTKLSKTYMHYINSFPMLLSQTYFHVLVHWIQKWYATVIVDNLKYVAPKLFNIN